MEQIHGTYVHQMCIKTFVHRSSIPCYHNERSNPTAFKKPISQKDLVVHLNQIQSTNRSRMRASELWDKLCELWISMVHVWDMTSKTSAIRKVNFHLIYMGHTTKHLFEMHLFLKESKLDFLPHLTCLVKFFFISWQHYILKLTKCFVYTISITFKP